MIVLSAGMQKAGTGWYFNLTNDLLVAAGYQDVRVIRQKYRLHSILKEHNCSIGQLTSAKLTRVGIPHLLGNTFVIKTHECPSIFLRYLMFLNMVKATYIYRDPRDIVVSALEHGQRIRQERKTHTFAVLDSIETSIRFVTRLLATYNKWTQCKRVFQMRYEELVAEPVNELQRLAGFLSLDVSSDDLNEVVATYQADRAREKGIMGLHLNEGIVGRFRDVMNKKELDLCNKHFGDYLEKMGYQK